MIDTNLEKIRKVRLREERIKINLPPLLSSELDFSYLIRVCRCNASDNPGEFINIINGRIGTGKIGKIRLDGINNDYDSIFKLDDGERFSERASILPILTMFMPEKTRKKIENSNTTKTVIREFLPSLSICPNCAVEDANEYGEVYYHMEHCVPGVSVCYKHGCALEKHSWSSGKTSLIPDKREVGEVLPLACEYAAFVHGLIAHLPFLKELSSKDIQYLLQRRVREKSNGMDIRFEPGIEEKKAYSKINKINLKQIMTTKNIIDLPAGLLMLVKLFETPEKFISYAKKHLDEKDIEKDIESTFSEDKNYTLERIATRNGLRYVELKHIPCNHSFWRGVSEFYTRASKCPYCRKEHNTKEGFRNDFEKKYGAMFTLLSEYNGSAKAITVGITGTSITLKDRPGAMKRRLDWLMNDKTELDRIIQTGVIRNIGDEKAKMLMFIEENYREDEPFLSSSLPPSPDLHIIMKALCDRGIIYRLDTGIYCRSLINFSDDEIINLKYIQNGKVRYGFDTGDRFLKLIMPSLTISPMTRTVVTNSNHLVLYHKMDVQVGAIKCSVYRSDIDINSENWKVLAMLAFFRHEDSSIHRDDHFIPEIAAWAIKEGITAEDIREYAVNCPAQTRETVKSLMREINERSNK